jgi:hypothetical protein
VGLFAVEEAGQGVRRVRSEDQLHGLVGRGGLDLAAGEHDGLVRRECFLDVVGVVDERLAEVRLVEVSI